MAVVSAIGHQAGFRIIRRLTRWTSTGISRSLLRMEQTLRVITIAMPGLPRRMELPDGIAGRRPGQDGNLKLKKVYALVSCFAKE